MNLNQVTVQSINIIESIRFYEEFGLTLIVEDKHYARFECPEGDATFSIEFTDKAVLSNTIVYFEVDDLEEKVLELKSKGFEFLKQPTKEPWLWYEAKLNDPSGNEICLYKAGENRKNPPWRIS